MPLRLENAGKPPGNLNVLLKLELMVTSSVVLSATSVLLRSVLLKPFSSFNDSYCSKDCCLALCRNMFVLVSIGLVVGTLLSDTSRYCS